MADLQKAFKTAMRGTRTVLIALGLPLTAITIDTNLPLRAIEPLSSGEVALAQSVFGPDFNAQRLRKYYYDRMPYWQRLGHLSDHDQISAYVASWYGISGNALHFVAPEEQAADFSQANSAMRGLFMHEMTHIWQASQRGIVYCRTYDYTLTANSRFMEFCNEQQGSIIADYTARFLTPSSALLHSVNYAPMALSDSDQLLADIVEEQFPHARTARLQIDAQARGRQSCFRTGFTQANGYTYHSATACTGEDNSSPATQPWGQRTLSQVVHSFRRFG